MRHIMSSIKKTIVKSLVGLEDCYSIGPRKYLSSSWYEDKIEEVNKELFIYRITRSYSVSLEEKR